MKNTMIKRMLSLLLVFSMLLGFAMPVQAAHDHSATETAAVEGNSLTFTEAENINPLERLHKAEETEEVPLYDDTDIVRVSIVLDRESTVESGFSTQNIADNADAMAYRENLQLEQDAMTASIEAAIGQKLDVVWNLTLVANLISANVEYGQIQEIAAIDGVKEVYLETRYEPAIAGSEEYDPNMATSGNQIGSVLAWANGYTGAGSRIAVIDTGIDSDHQSMDAAAFEYALQQNAAAKGMEYDRYVENLNLLDAEEIAGLLDQLHVGSYSAEDLYFNSKIAFGYNYIDEDLDIVHDNDTQGSHGSHVSGIATANKYIPNGDGTFSGALETVFVQGVAPDAQLITMKVFGKAGGAYDTDYMVAIEDAIILGCDSVNLSLGSASHGFVTNNAYQDLLDTLAKSDTVATISGGNNGQWASKSTSPAGLPYADDINFWTGGAPGSVANSLGVASVQNAGNTGIFVTVCGSKIVYNDYTKDGWTNSRLTTVGGDREYIFIDGVGSAEDWAVVGDALKGKIAICSRGTTSFFQKGIAAVEAGAIATIIYNNTDGTINMDLTDYTKTEPCVSITQADGALIKSLSTPVTDDAGNVLYYTGNMVVETKVGTAAGNDAYYTMSTFSSWGVPSALIMKPEITAPGGNIYSLNGVDTSGKAYENNSGTSMAAPQAAGMVALIGQYIRETGLSEKTGLTPRQLAQSLLMSTAVPLKEKASNGNYYSILNQGAGLANVGNAITANSYILMNADATASYADGKVKAELGDDPGRQGEYTFSFTLNNFSASQKTYTLRADFFTQALMATGGIGYLSNLTTPIAATVTYTVNGETFVPGSSAGCDLDNDGDTDEDDAQLLLDYLVGKVAEVSDIADVNKDGKINTYDAYLILTSMGTENITLPAGEKADIVVKITLSDAVKSNLNASYVNGAYLEGYVYVEPTSSTEGVMDDVTHSIPVLGFYGNWSDASMFEKNTYAARLYGDKSPTYFDPAAEGSDVTDTNALMVQYEGDSNKYYMVGNPFCTDETYPADRMAVGNTTTLKNWKITLLRNAAAVAGFVTNEAGEVVYLASPTYNVYGAYYYTSGAAWRNTSTTVNISKAVSKLDVKEGERITVGVVAIPEYYAANGVITPEDIQSLLESGALGEGATLTTTVTVDNTAPTVTQVTENLENNTITVTAQDENYLAAVRVTNLSGSKVYATVNPNQQEKGVQTDVVVDMEGISTGSKFLVSVADYAGNMTTYQVNSIREPADYTGQMFVWTTASSRRTAEDKLNPVTRWMKVDPDTLWYKTSGSLFAGTQTHAYTTYADQLRLADTAGGKVLAGDYVNGYVIFALKNGEIYNAPLDDMDMLTHMANWSDVVAERGGTTIQNFRMNYADGKMYLLDDAQNFYTFNLHTCALEYAFSVTLKNPNSTVESCIIINDFAIHKNGTFYALNKGSGSDELFLYSFALDQVQETGSGENKFVGIKDLKPVKNTTSGHLGFGGITLSTQMFWDHDKEILYMVRTKSATATISTSAFLYTIDCSTGKATVANSYTPEGETGGTSALLYTYVNATFVVSKNDGMLAPKDVATGVQVTAIKDRVLKNTVMAFDAILSPWNLENKNVTWSTSDPAMATINDKGVATFHQTGKVSIIATSVEKPNVTGAMEIEVVDYPTTTLSAAVTDADGNTWMSEFSTDDITAIDRITKAPGNFLAGGLHNGKVYYHDGAQMYAVDAETHGVQNLGALASSWQWSDVATAPRIGPSEAYLFDYLVGFSSSGMYIELITPETGTLTYFNLNGNSLFTDDPMATLCYAGPYPNEKYQGYSYYVLRESGKLITLNIYAENETGAESASITQDRLAKQTGLDLSGMSSVGTGAYISSFYDAANGYILLTKTNPGEQTELYAIDPNTGITAKLGTFPENVELVNGLYLWERAKELTVRTNVEELELYTDETYHIETTVLPVTYAQDVEWHTDNDQIATVTNEGTVSVTGAGTAELEVNTVATNEKGETASATVKVNAIPLMEASMKFSAQVTDSEGKTYWAEIDTTDMTITKQGESTVTLVGGGYHEGKIYGLAGDYTSGGYMYEIDPANGYAASQGAKYAASYACLDGASAPPLITDGTNSDNNPKHYTKCNFFVNLSASGNLLLMSDYTSGSVETIDLTTKMRGASAIAMTEESYYGRYNGYEYFILENDGDLHRIIIYPKLNNTNGTWRNTSYFYKQVGNIGRTLDNTRKATMTYIDNGTNKGLLLAYSGNENTELYFIELVSGNYGLSKLGTLDGITNLVSAYAIGEKEEEPLDPYGKMFTWIRTNDYRMPPLELALGYRDRWMVVDPDTLWFSVDSEAGYPYTGTTTLAMTRYDDNVGTVDAAEWVRGQVIFACNDGYLYAAPVDDINNVTPLVYWKNYMSTVNDMALNYADGYLYLLAPNGIFFKYKVGADFMVLDFVVSSVCPNSSGGAYEYPTTFAIDDDGNFYAVNYGGTDKTGKYCYLYTWKRSDVPESGHLEDLQPINTAKDGYTGVIGKATCHMTWDHDKDVLYIMGNGTGTSTGRSGQAETALLYTLDTTTGKASVCTDYVPEGYENVQTGVSGLMYAYTRALFVIPRDGGMTAPIPADLERPEEEEELNPAGKLFGFSNAASRLDLADQAFSNTYRWMTIDPDTIWYNNATGDFTGTDTYKMTTYGSNTGNKVLAAAYADGMVYMAGYDGWIYRAPLEDLDSRKQMFKWVSLVAKNTGSDRGITDMAYNPKDGYIYLLSGTTSPSTILKYDIQTDTMTIDYTVTITNPTKSGADYEKLRALAIDEEGNFWSVSSGTGNTACQHIYKWSLADVQEKANEDGTTSRTIENLAPINNEAGGTIGILPMAEPMQMVWNHDTDKLYLFGGSAWTGTQGHNAILYTVNTTTGAVSPVNNYYPEGKEGVGNPALLYNVVKGMFFVPADYVAPENVEIDPNAEAAAVPEVEKVSEQTVTVDVSRDAQQVFVPGTDTTKSSEIAISTDIRTLVQEHQDAAGNTNTSAVELTNGAGDAYTPEAVGSSYLWEMKQDETVTNGRFEVTFDPAKLQFGGFWMLNKNLISASYIDNDIGKAVFVFAAKEPIEAGTSLGYFSVNVVEKDAECIYTELTFQITELNEQVFADNTELLVLNKGGHNYQSIEDNDPSVITYQCTNCGHTYTEPTTGECDHQWGEWQETKAASCTEKGEEKRTCTQCGETETREVPAKGHTWGEWQETKAPTCTEKGEEKRTCSACGETETREVEAAGHKYQKTTTQPTCTEGGYDLYKCTVCGDEYKDNLTEPKGHTWGEWQETKAPTCTEKGEEKRTCSACGETETREVESEGHKYQKTTVEATCTEGGYDLHKCTVCGDEYKDNLTEPKGHSWGEWQETKAPTCTEKGEEKRNCSACGETETREVAAREHDYQKTVTAPTCTEVGYTTYTCAHCGDSYVSDYVAALGHRFGAWTQTKAASCTEPGMETRSCSVCGETETREVAAKGHNYQKTVTEPTCTDFGYTTYTCDRCGDSYSAEYIPPKGHSYGKTVTEPTCSAFGYTTFLCACGHSYVGEYTAPLGHKYLKVVTEPTCTEMGYTTYTCTRCGDSHKGDFVAAKGHTFGEWVVTKASTCTEDGKETRNCFCGETEERAIPATGHHFGQWEVTKKATCTENGTETRICTCGETEERTIKALGHNWSDWTVTKVATCTEEGEETRTCANCKKTEKRTIDALGHDCIGTITAPTCTTEGYTQFTCTVCGYSYRENIISALGHDYKAKVTAPTCTEDGYTTYTCFRCKDSYVSDYVDALGHAFGEWKVTKAATCTKEGTETRTCACGETQERAIPATGHSFGQWKVTKEATCTENGIETRICACGEAEERTIDALGHQLTSVTVEATCTEDGYTEFTCSVCGYSYREDVVEAIGHDYVAVVTEPTCTEGGYTEHTCSVCGDSYVADEVDALGHDWSEWTVTTEATCFVDGEETRTCATCGETETQVIEKNSDNCPSKVFTDLNTAQWYHEAVDYVLRNGLMNGISADTFAPNGTLTRAQLVTILYRLEGEPSVEGLENPFADVAEGAWYTNAIIWAADAGVVNGISATLFNPNGNITREQIATILYRYSGAEKVEGDYLADFEDSNKVSAYAVDAMNWAVANGLITGMDATTLAPTATATRAQIAAILMRYCQKN